MKKFQFLLILFGVIALVSCKKEMLKDKKGWDKDIKECSSNSYSEYEDGAKYTEYVVEPLYISEDCGCIEKGYLKYVSKEDGKTAALVKFVAGKESCESWIVKTICYDGDCDSKKAVTCKAKMDCSASE